jgi:hypothetical protein
VAYIVRKDLTEQDLLIPVINTDEYYGNEEMKNLKFIGWVNEVTYEDDHDGSLAKFQDPRGHTVFLYSIDLDWEEEA